MLEDRTMLSVTWSGGGSDSNWMTAANWVGNVAPVAGADLVFPTGAAQLSNVNNFGVGTSFNSLTISGNGYSISGNRVVTGAIDVSGSTGTNSFLADVTFTGKGTITLPSAAGNQLDLGNLDNGGNTLTFTGGLGTVLVEGGISGGAGLTMSATGNLILQNNNTFGGYIGATLISSGTISLTGSGGIPSSSALTDNGTLNLGGLNDAVASLSGSGSVTLGSGTLRVGAVSYPGTTFSGIISQLLHGRSGTRASDVPLRWHSEHRYRQPRGGWHLLGEYPRPEPRKRLQSAQCHRGC
jgi:hypothetical protein